MGKEKEKGRDRSRSKEKEEGRRRSTKSTRRRRRSIRRETKVVREMKLQMRVETLRRTKLQQGGTKTGTRLQNYLMLRSFLGLENMTVRVRKEKLKKRKWKWKEREGRSMQEKKRDIKRKKERNIRGMKNELEVERGGKTAGKEIGREGQDPERGRGVETEEGRGNGKAEIERREEKTASDLSEITTGKEGRTVSDQRGTTRIERAETGTREMTGARLEQCCQQGPDFRTWVRNRTFWSY